MGNLIFFVYIMIATGLFLLNHVLGGIFIGAVSLVIFWEIVNYRR